MSLRTKILVIVSMVVALFAGVNYGIQRTIIYPRFVDLERSEARKDLYRCVEAIAREIAALNVTCEDYASWNDTCQFAARPEPEYIKQNLNVKNFQDLHVNLIYVCNSEGKIVWGQVLNLETGERLNVRGLPRDQFPASHPLAVRTSPEDQLSGILATDSGAMLVASYPILTDDSEGPVRGALIMGKFLTAQVMDRLKEQTRVDLRADPLLVTRDPAELAPITGEKLSRSEIVLDDSERRVLQVSTVLKDIYGRPALPIQAVVPRQITAKGKATMAFAAASVVVAALVVLVTLQVMLQRVVVTPLSRLTEHAVAIGKSDDLSASFGSDRQDEVGILGRAFDAMVAQLADARRKLLDESYRSGLAEMASGILHNVRNALTPVLVDVEALREELARTPLDQIEVARRELDSGSLDESRKTDLSRFLDLANDRLVTVARQTSTKLENVMGRARQIEQFLTDQEGLSRADRPMEEVRLHELIREATDLLPNDLRGCTSVQTDSSVSDLGPVRTHRICLLQILTNLLANAAEAIQRSERGCGRVDIRADVEAVDGGEMIHLQVKDDGVGIEAENLERVFQRGFTTKQGSSGLGLHWCANSIVAMKGRIYAESGGTGEGACFHLLIPWSR